MGFRQASEMELLLEHIPLSVFKYPSSDMDTYHCVPCSMNTLVIFIKDASETIIISASLLGQFRVGGEEKEQKKMEKL